MTPLLAVRLMTWLFVLSLNVRLPPTVRFWLPRLMVCVALDDHAPPRLPIVVNEPELTDNVTGCTAPKRRLLTLAAELMAGWLTKAAVPI